MPMISNVVLIRSIDEHQLKLIYKKLGEDVDKLRNRQVIFKQWIDCEKHIPKNIDQRIIDNFIRLSKFDIERAKAKFEMWLYVRGKYPNLYGNPSTSKQLSIHRPMLFSRGLTEGGYKVIIVRMKDMDTDKFDYELYLRYCMMYMEYFLLNDINAGCEIIFDMDGFNARILAKINLTLFKAIIEIVTKVDPRRIQQVHIVGLPKLAQGLYTIGRALLPEKIKQRIILHKDSSTLLDYIKPNDILPNEYGGKDGTCQDLADSAWEFLVNDVKFQAEREKWFLAAELPTEKMKKLTFDDHGTAGSFRQLQID